MSKVVIYHNNLCSDLWDEFYKLNSDIRLNLLKIAKDFYEKTKFEAPILDIYFMGSMASFNWNAESDIDIHVVIDLKKLNMPEETAEKMAKLVGSQWNSEHDILIKNHKVEMNIQSLTAEKPYVNGIYSLIKNQWVKKPSKQNPNAIDTPTIQLKYNGMKKYILDTIATGDREKLKAAKDYIDAFRQYGLDNDGELSSENIAYKLLRTKGIIKKLKDAITDLYDIQLSINESINDVNAKTTHFSIKANQTGLSKGAVAIYLGDEHFANSYQIQQGFGHGKFKEGEWVINKHTGAFNRKMGDVLQSFPTLQELLEYLEKWYESSEIKEITQSDINAKFPLPHQINQVGNLDLNKLSLSNLKSLRDKAVRIATDKKLKIEDPYNQRPQATKDFILYQNEIKRRLEIINRPINEAREADYDACADFQERRDEALQEMGNHIKHKKGRIHWHTISATLLKKTWLIFGKYQKINENDIDKIADNILTNIAKLYAANELQGHSENYYVREELADNFGIEFTDEEWNNIDYDAFTDKHGHDFTSDYGIKPLQNIYSIIFNAKTPEEKLYACDKALNVVHQRNDLAAMFVEGGQTTLTQIANQGGYNAGYEYGQMNREFRENILKEAIGWHGAYQAILLSNPPKLVFTNNGEDTHVAIFRRVFNDEMETLMSRLENAGYGDLDDPDCQYPAANQLAEKYNVARCIIEHDGICYVNTPKNRELTNSQLRILRDYCIEHKLRLKQGNREIELDENMTSNPTTASLSNKTMTDLCKEVYSTSQKGKYPTPEECATNTVKENISKFYNIHKLLKNSGSVINKKMRLIENGLVPSVTINTDDNLIINETSELMAAFRLNLKTINVNYVNYKTPIKESIDEVFKVNLPCDIEKLPNGDYTSNFKIGDENYTVNIKQLKEPNNFRIEFFKIINRSKVNDFKDIYTQVDSMYGNSNLRNHNEVYSHVLSIFNKFITEKQPEKLIFDIRDEQRNRIYSNIINKYIGDKYDFMSTWETDAYGEHWIGVSSKKELKEGYGGNPDTDKANQIKSAIGNVGTFSHKHSIIVKEGMEDAWENKGKKVTLKQILDITKNVKPQEIKLQDLSNMALHADNPDERDTIDNADLKYPILVLVNDDGSIKYILDGHHRIQKSIKLKLNTIQCKLIKFSDLPNDFKDVLGEGFGGNPDTDKAYVKGDRWRVKWDNAKKTPLMKENLNSKWASELYSRFPSQLADEIIDERPKGDMEDHAEISKWKLTSNTPIEISIEKLLKHKEQLDSISRSPEEVIDCINKKWNLNVSYGKQYDARPERYFQYAKMDSSTAKPSVLVNGQIYWGVGRFIAALIRGDKKLKVWDIKN